MKKQFLTLVLAVAFMIGCIPTAFAGSARSWVQNLVGHKWTGSTEEFTIHKTGRVRFYTENNGEEAITVTLHKINRGQWVGPIKANGQSSFEVNANDGLLVDTDGASWWDGIYQFKAENAEGTLFKYTIDLRELDYDNKSFDYVGDKGKFDYAAEEEILN